MRREEARSVTAAESRSGSRIKAPRTPWLPSRSPQPLRSQHRHGPAPSPPARAPAGRRRRRLPGGAAGRGAALPLPASRDRGHPSAAVGPHRAARRGAALLRARGHSHDEAGTDALPEPLCALGQAHPHQDPQQEPAGANPDSSPSGGQVHVSSSEEEASPSEAAGEDGCWKKLTAQLSSSDEFMDQLFYDHSP